LPALRSPLAARCTSMARTGHSFGAVVSFSAYWKRGTRPLRISVCVERIQTQHWTADAIARQLVARACILLKCEPRDLKLKSHPADGLIVRYWRKGKFNP
jgi:hypothetical protein